MWTWAAVFPTQEGKYSLAAGNSAWGRLVGTTHPGNKATLPLRSVKPCWCPPLGWWELIICTELREVIYWVQLNSLDLALWKKLFFAPWLKLMDVLCSAPQLDPCQSPGNSLLQLQSETLQWICAKFVFKPQVWLNTFVFLQPAQQGNLSPGTDGALPMDIFSFFTFWTALHSQLATSVVEIWNPRLEIWNSCSAKNIFHGTLYKWGIYQLSRMLSKQGSKIK